MTPEQAEALRKPFPKSAIGKLPKGGVLLDYVGHAATTDRLLAVDPAWTWEPVAFDETGLPAFQGRNLWIRLTVCGVTRYGVGDGASIKEAIGDAIRNAAMRFGVALDLWSKEELESHHEERTAGAPPQQRPAPQQSAPPQASPKASSSRQASEKQVKMMGALMSKLGMSDRDLALQFVADVIGRQVASRNELTSREASQVIDALQKDLNGPTPPDPHDGGDPWADAPVAPDRHDIPPSNPPY